MANHLDDIGHRDLADFVDDIISKLSSELTEEEEPTDEGWSEEVDEFDRASEILLGLSSANPEEEAGEQAVSDLGWDPDQLPPTSGDIEDKESLVV